jgi:hypothetical protein
MQDMYLLRYIGSHTNLGGRRCARPAYRLPENRRIWFDLDGGFETVLKDSDQGLSVTR